MKIFDRKWRLENLYKIRKEDRTLGKMTFTPLQEKLYENAKSKRFRGIRVAVPKARKARVSTWYLLFYLDDTMFHSNVHTTIIAHRDKDVKKLFKIVKLAHRTCPDEIKLKDGRTWSKPLANYDNVNELRFDGVNSSISIALEVRGDTPNNLHISEAHYIEDEKIKASLGSVPNIKYGSNITIESTGNGVGGFFYDLCEAAQAGNSVYDLMFSPWFNKAENSYPAPEDFAPTQEEITMRDRVRTFFNIELSNDQLFWWRMTKAEQGRLMPQEFPTLIEDCFMATGNVVFEMDKVINIKVQPPKFKRRIEVDIFDPNKEKRRKIYEVSIWEEPKPGHRYVVGGDPSEGIGGDNSVVEVFDAITLNQVAEIVAGDMPPDHMDVVVDNLARYYNMAIAAIERNNHGHLVLDRLKTRYPHIYCKVITDEKTLKKTKKLGWETNSHTRDMMLDRFEQLVRECTVTIRSAILKSELLTFIVNEDGKRIAKTGKKDDTILASAITLEVARMPRTSFALFGLL